MKILSLSPAGIVLLIFASVSFCSCFSLSIDKSVDIDRSRDWLCIGGDSLRSNVSLSKSKLNPPFRLYWEFNTDGGLATNCISAADAIVFVSTLNAECFAIDISSGRSLGRTSTGGRSSFSTPLISDNNIIITSSGASDSRISSFDLIIGKSIWSKNVGWVESSPVISGENVIVSSLNGRIYKLDISTGKIVWITDRILFDHYMGSFYTTPVITGNVVAAGNEDGNMYAYDLGRGKSLWKFQTGASIYCDASAREGRIYFGSDDYYFYCTDTLGNLVWKKNLESKIYSSPSFYEKEVIISCINGKVHSLNRLTGEDVWEFSTKGSIKASPLVQDDKVFIGSYDRFFYCLDAIDGKLLWKYETEGRVKTSAVIWKDYIFVGGDDKYLYCFSNNVIPNGK